MGRHGAFMALSVPQVPQAARAPSLRPALAGFSGAGAGVEGVAAVGGGSFSGPLMPQPVMSALARTIVTAVATPRAETTVARVRIVAVISRNIGKES